MQYILKKEEKTRCGFKGVNAEYERKPGEKKKKSRVSDSVQNMSHHASLNELVHGWHEEPKPARNPKALSTHGMLRIS